MQGEYGGCGINFKYFARQCPATWMDQERRYCPPESGGQWDRLAIPRGVVPIAKHFGFGTTPPSLRSGTPPDSGGEFRLPDFKLLLLPP